MLKISLFELLTRGIAEGFLFVLAVYAFAKKKIIPLPFLLSSLALILFTYGVRLLNINFGVHTILNLICLVCLSVFVNKIGLFKSVKGSMIATLSMFVIEAVNVAILQLVFKDELKAIIDNPYQKAIAGIPGIALFGIVIVIAYFKLTGTKKNRGIDGKTSE